MTTVTILLDALKSLQNEEFLALNDGSTHWYIETLISELRGSEEGLEELEKEVVISGQGIHFGDDVNKDLAYMFVTGKWNDNGEFEQ